MNRDDFVKLVGVASDDDQYVPVAFLLCNGYACAGYYHPPVNKGLAGACVLLNARLIELRGDNKVGGQPSINDFNEFLEEIVVNFCEPSGNGKPSSRTDAYGKSIPLTAIPFEQIAVVYPVAHIGSLMRRAERQKTRPPRFLDLNQSEIIKLLQTKLW
ncbi:MAG: hypothetical protein WCB27_04770 [Thermoguttaceae bacterium]|jgi:hypothetical protein